MNNTTEPSKPKFFYCYLDNEIILQHLSDEQAGNLWKRLFEYTNRNEKNNIPDPVIAMAFDVMTQQIDRDFKKYQDKCEKNRANASQRKRPLTIVNDGSQEKDKEKEKDNNINTMSTVVDGGNTFDYQAVVNSFNSICVSLPKVKTLNDKRKRQIKSAYKLLGDVSFEEYFNMIESSDFLTGRNEKWANCGFDWCIKPANIVKVLEGNYSKSQQNATTSNLTYSGYNKL